MALRLSPQQFLGGTQSGNNGGILGLGLIGNAVGMVWGLIVGAVGGAVTYAALGWEKSVEYSNAAFEAVVKGTFIPWGQS